MLGGGLASVYHVPDTWQTYASLKPVLDRRFDDWRGAGLPEFKCEVQHLFL
jgi:hypothetical protein